MGKLRFSRYLRQSGKNYAKVVKASSFFEKSMLKEYPVSCRWYDMPIQWFLMWIQDETGQRKHWSHNGVSGICLFWTRPECRSLSVVSIRFGGEKRRQENFPENCPAKDCVCLPVSIRYRQGRFHLRQDCRRRYRQGHVPWADGRNRPRKAGCRKAWLSESIRRFFRSILPCRLPCSTSL